LCFLVDTSGDGGSASLGDSKLTIDGLTGSSTFAGLVVGKTDASHSSTTVDGDFSGASFYTDGGDMVMGRAFFVGQNGGGTKLLGFNNEGTSGNSCLVLHNYTDSASHTRFYHGGDVEILDGNLKFASGHGIDFSAHGNASGMTSELLDDYEEGTSTATLSATSSGTITIGTSLMQDKISYTKIGQIVFFKARLTMTVSSPSGELRINNLPFDAANPSGDAAQVCTVYFENSNGDLANDIVGLIADGSNSIIIRESGTGGTGTNLAANTMNSTVLIVSGHYFTVSV